MSVQHATFSIERHLDASPALVFAAWADPARKRRWFVGPQEDVTTPHALDFRVGGAERIAGRFHGGPVHSYVAEYRDIVPDQRIVYAYDMWMDDKHISVSLSTVEFEPAGQGTRMRFTEQDVFLDGYDDAGSRRRGTEGLLDQLEAEVKRELASSASAAA